jgi:hypothetical protein
VNSSVLQYYRCPEHYLQIATQGPLSDAGGFFRFGRGIVCFGKSSGQPSESPAGALYDAAADATVKNGVLSLPFDLDDVAANLRFELYTDFPDANQSWFEAISNQIYYFVRPALPVKVRKYLQRVRLSDWSDLPFPHWPVDRTVDDLFEQTLLLSLKAQGVERIPFVWFWPEGASGGAIMTHDVETAKGRDFSGTLMDINDSFGIKASFQVVPETRYEVTPKYLESIAKRGFEVAVQDLNHDGHLYRSREEFEKRVAKINAYGRKWGAKGFRSAILYRRQEWFGALEFSYDMSVPNVAHLDPQRGGCCTVMPYFIGKLLELPVTITQDYSLFHILQEHSIALWKRQIELILEKHGLISAIVHPDYIMTAPERQTYEELLSHLVSLREEKGVWVTTPGEVNQWWRQRAQMNIVEDGGTLRIKGPGSERACIAYASAKDGRLDYTLASKNVNERITNPANEGAYYAGGQGQ